MNENILVFRMCKINISFIIQIREVIKMVIKNIRTFIPAKNLTESKEYYLDLGFNILWEGNKLIILGDENNNFI